MQIEYAERGKMRHFCIITNRDKDTNLEITNKIIAYLTSKKKEVFLAKEQDKESGFYTDAATIPKNTECAIVLGGDGTILQAAHDLLGYNIPILGINLGTLGFMAETELQNVWQALDALFDGDYVIEERMMLNACVLQSSNEIYSDKNCTSALNDIVITRSGFSRIIGVRIYVNGAFVNDFRGDGVIISTPTGSTGYNLSAGGPVVTPEAELTIITPICPHSLNARSIVVTSNDKVTIKIRESKKTQEEEAIATIDGCRAIQLKAGDSIEIGKAVEVTKLIRVGKANFFHILRTKLGDANN